MLSYFCVIYICLYKKRPSKEKNKENKKELIIRIREKC